MGFPHWTRLGLFSFHLFSAEGRRDIGGRSELEERGERMAAMKMSEVMMQQNKSLKAEEAREQMKVTRYKRAKANDETRQLRLL